MKFQALGSNYDFAWCLRQLFATGDASDQQALVDALQSRFGGQATLYSKGRNALSAAISASVKPGETVAINALTCSVVVEAIEAVGADVHYIDVAVDSADYDAAGLEQALADNPKITVVIVQNTYGQMMDIASIETITKHHKLTLIEDLAHSVGQSYADGRLAGTVGDYAMISFGRDKLLDVVNGGAIISRQQRLETPIDLPTTADQFRDRFYPLLAWLVRTTYDIGLGKLLLRGIYELHLANRSADGGIHQQNLPSWQAKLALRRFQALDRLSASRQQRTRRYAESITSPLLSPNGSLRSALLVRHRDSLLAQLRESGYELSDTWYDTPVGPARKYAHLDYPTNDCPRAVAVAKRVINLPTHDVISKADILAMSRVVNEANQ